MVRVTGGNAIQLRTDQATGRPLRSGDYIRAESNLAVAAKTWGTKALAIIAVAAVLGVICLRRFLAFKAAAPFVPILAAVVLALVTAYAAHGAFVPFVRDFVLKSQANAQLQSQQPASSEAGWVGKAQGLEKQFAGFLRTPTDAPRLLSFVLSFVLALPIFACLIAWLFRKLACQPTVCGLLLLVALQSALNAAPGQPGVFYTRDFLKDEQRVCSQSLSEVERNLAAASRLLDANLSSAPEHLVRALFLNDLVGIRLEGQPDRIAQLKSSFGYTRSEEQRRLSAVYADLRQQLQTAQLDAAKLAERCAAGTNVTTILQVFQARQTDYRNLIRAGVTDAKTILEDCNRQLIQFAQARKEEPKPQEDERTRDELARLQQEQTQLQSQLATLRLAQDEAAAQRPLSPQVLVVTNEVRIETLVPTPAPPPKIEYVTNVLVITNQTEVPSQNEAVSQTLTATTNVAAVGSTNGAPASVLPPVDLTTSGVTSAPVGADPKAKVIPLPVITKARGPVFALNKTTLYVVGLILVAGFVWVALIMSGRRAHVLQLAQDGKPLEPFEIGSADDVVVLESVPRVEHRSQVDGQPSIRATWLGSILYPGRAAVAVNDTPVEKPKRLRAGDRVTAATSATESRTFDFLGCDSITESVEA